MSRRAHLNSGRSLARGDALRFVLIALLTLGGLDCSAPIAFDRLTPEEPDAGEDAGSDAGEDAGSDAGEDAGSDAGEDAGSDAGGDAGSDAGSDAGDDAGSDAGSDAGEDAGSDAGSDAGDDAGSEDAGPEDGGVEPIDGGPICPDFDLPDPAPPIESNASVGQPCIIGVGGPSNCAQGLQCHAFAPGKVAFCTSACSDNEAPCGPDASGRCVYGSPNLCLARCDDETPCPVNTVCSYGACIPDCRLEPPTYCALQHDPRSICSATTGQCESVECASDDECPSGSFCDSSVCVTDCTAVPSFCCKLSQPIAPQACDAESRRCNPGAPFAGGYGLQLKPMEPHIDAGTVIEEPPDAGVIISTWDGGPAPSCAPFDGGPVSGLSIPSNGQLGDLCEPFHLIEERQQGSCADGLLCGGLPKSGVAFCYGLCTEHSECGFTDTLQNICGGNNPAHRGCLQACDETHACPSQMACQPMNMGGRQVQVCLPDCRLTWDTYCHTAILENTHCDPADGVCRVYGCDQCPAGTVCDTTRTPNVCRIDCRTQAPNFCCSLMRDEGPVCPEETGICRYYWLHEPPVTCNTTMDCGYHRFCVDGLCRE